MEIDQKPSVLPRAAMLFVLLLLCLGATVIWKGEGAADAVDDSPLACVTEQIGAYENYPLPNWHLLPPKASPEHELLLLWDVPTIEELVAARSWTVKRGEDLANWPTLPPRFITPHGETRSYSSEAALKAMEPFRGACVEIGRMLAQGPVAAELPRHAANLSGAYQHWISQTIELSNLTPLVTSAGSSLRLMAPTTARGVAPDQACAENIEPWCVPSALFDQLEQLACHPQAAEWAEDALAQLRLLTERNRMDGDDVRPILARLGELAQEAVRLADECDDDPLRVSLLRAHWGLARRLDAWGVLYDIRLASVASQRLAARGELSGLLGGDSATADATTRHEALARRLEAYEETNSPRLARQVAVEQQALKASPNSLDQALSESVEQHYRNANVRVAITGEFINRFVAQERAEIAPVRDRIAGTPVRGMSETHAQNRVRLAPANDRWQMVLETEGVVQSNSLADGGHARLRSRSETDFVAEKTITVDQNGVQVEKAEVNATNQNRLVGVTTDFDWVPLLNSYARHRAVHEYRARRGRARNEVEFKVSSKAGHQIDRETQEVVERIEHNLRENVTNRLAVSGVEVTPIEMTTTPERVVGRFRVAGEHQLGSHTPRPRALSDSLASVQLHESAITNAATSLQLDGGRFTAPEMQEHFRQCCPRLALRNSEARDDVEFQFTPQDAISFHIDDGKLELKMAFVFVRHEERTMKNIVVHGYYVPVVNGLEVSLKRDGALGFEGRISSGDRARLYNIFNSVLSAERNLPIVKLENPNDPRLEGLTITQFVLEDGWLGFAVGPGSTERVAERLRSWR